MSIIALIAIIASSILLVHIILITFYLYMARKDMIEKKIDIGFKTMTNYILCNIFNNYKAKTIFTYLDSLDL